MIRTKRRIDILNLLRYILLAILMVYIAILFWAKGESSASFDQVAETIRKAAAGSEMEEAKGRKFRQLYGLNENEFEEVMLYYTDQTMGVEEVLLIKAKSSEGAQRAKEAAETRVQTQINNFEGYGAEQVKILKNAIIKMRGDYVFMAISPHAEKFENAFKKRM